MNGAAVRYALLPLHHPAVWAWPCAAWLTWRAHYELTSGELRLAQHYLPALGLVLIGCLPSMFERRPSARAPQATFLPRWLLIVLTLALLAGATALRLWHITTWPVEGIGFEEQQLGGRAPPLPWTQSFLSLYSQPGEHTLTVWATAVSLYYFGGGFMQLRLPFMLAGIACPFLFYAVCRKLVSWEVSLFALALFAVSWWQIAVSRFADEIFFPVWAELAILWLLLHFEDTGRAWAAYGVGVLTGLLVYEYTSYHLVIVVVVGYLVARGAVFLIGCLAAPDASLGRSRQIDRAVRRYGPGVLALSLALLIIAHWQLLGDLRAGILSAFSGGIGGHRNDVDGLLAQRLRPAEMADFVWHKLLVPIRAAYLPGQTHYCRHIGMGGAPFFDPATAIAIGLGAMLVGLTFWGRFHAFVLTWALAVVAGAALLPGNPNPHRYYTGLPLYYLLVALGAEVLWRWARRPVARWALLGALATGAAYASVHNIHHVFWFMMPDDSLSASLRFPRTEVVRWIRAHPRGDWICAVIDDDPSEYGANPLDAEWQFLVRGWNVRVALTPAECIHDGSAGSGPRYYLFTQRQPQEDPERVLRAQYPNAQELPPVEDLQHQFRARAFYVPPQGT